MKKIFYYSKYIFHSIRLRGVVSTFTQFSDNLDFDIRYNTETATQIEIDELKVVGTNRRYSFRYESTLESVFKKIMEVLPKRFFNTKFIDFGSGKGKILMLASIYFKKVIGVEFSSKLCAISLKNISEFSRCFKHDSEISVYHKDAIDLLIPDDACVFYFFNPFHECILEKVLDQIDDSFNRRRREIIIIYVYALYKKSLFRRGFSIYHRMKEMSREAGIYTEEGIYIFCKK